MTLAGGDPYILIPNNAELALLTPIAGAGRSYPMIIECASAIPSSWPSEGWVTVDQEIFRYTGKAGATLTGCTGEQQDTALIAHGAGAPVGLYVTRDTYWPLVNRCAAMAVYKDSVGASLSIGVKPGFVQCGDLVFNHPGSTSHALTASSTNYVECYVDAAGGVVIAVNTTGWTNDYFPLATVVTDGSDVISINDCRAEVGANPGNQEHALYTIRDEWTVAFGGAPIIAVPLNIYLQKIYFDGPNVRTVNQYEIGIRVLGGAPQLGVVSLALYYSDDFGTTLVYQAGSNADNVPLVGALPTGLLTAVPAGAPFSIRSDRQNVRQWYLAIQGDAAANGEGWQFAGFTTVNTLLAPAQMYPVYDGGASGGINNWPTPIAGPGISTSLFWGKIT